MKIQLSEGGNAVAIDSFNHRNEVFFGGAADLPHVKER